MIDDDHNGGWWHAGGSGPVRPGPTPWLELRVNTLSQAKNSELRGFHQHKMDPDHKHIPPYLNHGALTGIGEGPGTLPGKYTIVLGDLNSDIG